MNYIQKRIENFEISFSSSQVGMIYVLISTIAFFFHNLLFKILDDQTAIQKLLIVNLIGIIISVFLMKEYKIPILSESAQINRYVILRGVFGTIQNFMAMRAIMEIPISEFQSIFYSGPIWVSILAYFRFGEQLSKLEIYCSIVCFLGVLMIAKPTDPNLENTKWYFIVLIASWLYAVSMIILRIIGSKTSVLNTNLSFSFFNFFLAFILFFQTEWMYISLGGWFWLILIGISNSIGCLTLARGIALVKLGRGTLLNYLQLFYGYIFDVFYFQIVLNSISLLGCLLIIMSSLLIVLKKIRFDGQNSSINDSVNSSICMDQSRKLSQY